MRPALLLMLALSPAPALAALTYEEGVARDPATQAELYREQHWVRSEGARTIERLVLYRCADGTPFGRKRVDYRPSPVAPDFHFEDGRTGYVEGLLRRGNVPTVFVRALPGVAERVAALPSSRLVADAGFDEFIRRPWPTLVAGPPIAPAFPLAPRAQNTTRPAPRVTRRPSRASRSI